MFTQPCVFHKYVLDCMESKKVCLKYIICYIFQNPWHFPIRLIFINRKYVADILC